MIVEGFSLDEIRLGKLIKCVYDMVLREDLPAKRVELLDQSINFMPSSIMEEQELEQELAARGSRRSQFVKELSTLR